MLERLDWTRGACRPLEGDFLIEKPARFARNSCISKLLWGPPEHADIFCSKFEKVTKKVGPRNRAHRLEFAKVAGPPFGHSGNKPNGICVWGRSICYSVNLAQNPGTQTDKHKVFRTWASRLGSPLTGGNKFVEIFVW